MIFIFFVSTVEAKRSRINNYIGTGSNQFSNKVNGYFKNNGTYVNTHQRSKKIRQNLITGLHEEIIIYIQVSAAQEALDGKFKVGS